jgi:putative endonuclease
VINGSHDRLMSNSERAPGGPRGAVGAAAETAVAAHLRGQGWTVLGRNLRIGRDEIDILALEPGPPDVVVVVEVRARSGPGYGTAVESVDAGKVARLYRALGSLRRAGHASLPVATHAAAAWRVDLLAVRRAPDGSWRLERHLRGLQPP